MDKLQEIISKLSRFSSQLANHTNREYFWSPEVYDQTCQMQYKTSLQLLKQCPLKDKKLILDIGCGTGNIDFHLVKSTPGLRLIGIDKNASMVDYAKKQQVALGLDNQIEFLVQDVQEIKYTAQFDLAISFWTLSWVTDQENALKRITASLKPGGELFLMYPMKHDVYNVIETALSQAEWAPYFNNYPAPRPFYTKSDYEKILEKLPLEHVELNDQIIPYRFSDKNAMLISMISWMAQLERLPPEKIRPFLETIYKNYLVQHSQDDTGSPSMFFHILLLRAKKKL